MVEFIIDGVARSASCVAEHIHLGWVDDTSWIFKPEELYIPENKRCLFLSKVYLFCEAASLRVLLTEMEGHESLQEVVREFERLIFPSQVSPEGMAKLEAIKSSMTLLDALFFEKKEFTWCRQWLRGIGHDETSPETLMLLAYSIGMHTKSLRQLVHEIAPPAARQP